MNTMKTPETSDPLKRAATVSDYLKAADRLVKTGNYEAALEEVTKARKLDPKNLYALAYEERLKATLEQAARRVTPRTQPEVETEHAALEKIRRLAEEEARRRAEEEARRLAELEARRKEEEERQAAEEARRRALQMKVSEFVRKAEEFMQAARFDRALDEVARGYVIDPLNESLKELERRIRAEQENFRIRAEEERRRREEEQKRQEQMFREQLEKKRKEEEARLQAEEQARREAQHRKVVAYIEKAKEYISSKRFDEALGELAFAVVLDPLNEEILSLQSEIRAEQEKQRLMEEEARRKEEERRRAEEEKKLAAIRQEVTDCLRKATVLFEQREFERALDELARAYVVDPFNNNVRELEEKIRAEQDRVRAEEEEQRRRAEEEARRRFEEELQRKREEELRQMEEAIQERAREEEKRIREEQVKAYLSRSESYLQEGKLEEALGEVSLAFILDPLNPEIAAQEQRIWAEQERRRSEEEAKREAQRKEALEREAAKAAELQSFLNAARTLLDKGEFGAALDEIAKAYAIDPVNAEVETLDAEIRAKMHAAHEAEEARKKAEEEQKAALLQEKIQKHLESVRKFMAEKHYTEALDELALAFVLDPDREEIHALEQEIYAAQETAMRAAEQKREKEEAEKRKAQIQEILDRAEELLMEKNYESALDELTKAYALDPLDPSIAEMEQRIRDAENGKPVEDQEKVTRGLRLVYRKR